MTTKLAFFAVFAIFTTRSLAQNDSTAVIAELRKFQAELNEEYRDATKSPLSAKDRSAFKGHDFFPIDLSFRVTAKFIPAVNASFFLMKTTSMQSSEQRVYGYVEFVLQGKNFKLPVYQSSSLMRMEAYKDYLFFPFADPTNGVETYHGGRYIDLRIPTGTEIVIDFNKAYNPYCAYANGFSCPLVPKENYMDVKVNAGIRYHEK